MGFISWSKRPVSSACLMETNPVFRFETAECCSWTHKESASIWPIIRNIWTFVLYKNPKIRNRINKLFSVYVVRHSRSNIEKGLVASGQCHAILMPVLDQFLSSFWTLSLQYKANSNIFLRFQAVLDQFHMDFSALPLQCQAINRSVLNDF